MNINSRGRRSIDALLTFLSAESCCETAHRGGHRTASFCAKSRVMTPHFFTLPSDVAQK